MNKEKSRIEFAATHANEFRTGALSSFGSRPNVSIELKMKKLILCTLGLFLVIACKDTATETTTEENTPFAKVESFLKEAEANGFSGSVLVDHKGSIFTNGYGFSDLSEQRDNTPNTVFDIGSIAKQFTAAGILKLEMEGKLSVQDLMSDYFEHVPEDKKSITLHHLLTHAAGFPGGIGDDYEAISTSEFVEQVMKTPLRTPPGETYHYSNVGFSLLAIIIEKVSGKSYESYLSEALWKPAKMVQTGYVLPKWSEDQIAVGYRGDNRWGKPNEKNWSPEGPYLHLKGNGGILSTVEDMHRWHEALLTNDILSEEAKSKYYTKHIPESASGNSFYGYGWALVPTPRNTTLITHNGGNGVFFADFWRYLSEDITIIMLSNKANRMAESVPMEIAGLLIVPDYEPQFPSEEDDYGISEEEIDALVLLTLETIRDGNPETWKPFIESYGSEDFQGMVPMETHMEYFSNINEALSEGTLESIMVENDEVIAGIQTPNGTKELIIFGAIGENNTLKIDGLKIN